MYLFLGFLAIQIVTVLVKLFQSNLSVSSILFSIAVVFIWSFIPFTGYWLAKLFKANGNASKQLLFVFGICIGLIEKSLFYFDVLSNKQTDISLAIVFVLFFIVAYISTTNDIENSGELTR
mgnify:CR=1 FL=1